MAAVAKRHRGAPNGNRNGSATKGQPKGQSLTKALGNRICAHVATGTPKIYAARAEGVSINAVLEWVRRGEGRDERPATPLMTEFAKALRKAEADDINRRKVRLDKIADDGDPRVDMWWLERRHPAEFGRPVDRVEVTGAAGGAIEIKLAFDPTPIAARSRAELGGPVLEGDAEEIL